MLSPDKRRTPLAKTSRSEKFGQSDRREQLGRLKAELSRKMTKHLIRTWYVFFADYGGQVLASVPADLLPEDTDPCVLERALVAMNDHTWPDEPMGAFFQPMKNHDRFRQPVPLRRGLEGWRAIGSIGGGMGGGLLLDDDMWFHPGLVVSYGLEFMEKIRTCLGIKPLEDAELIEVGIDQAFM